MKLHTITAPTKAAALKQVEELLGPGAIIVSSNKDGNQHRIIAALDRDFFEVPKAEPEVDQQKLHSKIEQILGFHKVPGKIADEMLAKISGKKLKGEDDALYQMMSGYFGYAPVNPQDNTRIMLFGQPGIGKTLAISKLMAQAVFHDFKVNVITTDIKRAGGVEQLKAFTKILKIPLTVAKNPEELATALVECEGGITLIDTSGINPYSQEEIDGLMELLSVADIEPIEPVLVMPAGGDVEEGVEMAKAFRNIGAERMIITKADSARRFGSVVTVARIMKLKFANFSGTPNVAKTLEAITPEAMSVLLKVS